MSTAPRSKKQPFPGVILPLVFTLALLLLAACTYQQRVAPISLPDDTTGIVVGNGLRIAGHAITDPKEAEDTLGFNAVKAGLLAVRLTFKNDSKEVATVNPEQTFLIDRNNNAWPILNQTQAAERAQNYVDVGETLKGAGKPALLLGAAGAVAGAAIGILTGENVGEAMGKGAAIGAAGGMLAGGGMAYAKTNETVRHDLAGKTLHNDAILPGQIAYGFLFFPGMPEAEAKGAVELRLGLTLGSAARAEVVRLALH